jgi:putative adhesin
MSMRLLLPTLLVAAFPLAVMAATPINETRPLDARGKVEISNVKGRIQVRVWDKHEVHIGGSLGRGVEKLDIEGDSDELEVKVRYPHNINDRNSEPTILVLDVPTLASLDIDGVSADIDVTGSAGRTLEINSVSGEVSVASAPGSADIESVSGDLRLTLNSANVDVQTVSGNVTLRGRLSGEVQAETVSGTLGVDSRNERVRRLSSNSVSGDATIRVGLADDGRITAESVSGNITVIAPKSLSANVSGESFSGHLSAPGASIHKPEFGPGSDFEQRYGNGSGEIHMETFSGSAELRLE